MSQSRLLQDVPAARAIQGSWSRWEHVRTQGHASTIRRRRRRSRRVFAGCMRCAVIPMARSAASRASCARRVPGAVQSPSTRRRARTAPAAPRATTSICSSASTADSARRVARWIHRANAHPRISLREARREHHDKDKLLAVGDRYEAQDRGRARGVTRRTAEASDAFALLPILFYTFAALLVLAALGIISARNPVHSALLARAVLLQHRGVSGCSPRRSFWPWCSCSSTSAR